MSQTPNQIELFIEGCVGLTTIIVFIVGIIRYQKEQTWKRKEFVSREIKEFFEDQRVYNCLLMLDWDLRYIQLYPDNPDYDSRFKLIGRKSVTIALIPHGSSKQKYTRDQAVIRDNFDYFFDRFSRFEHFIQAKLVKPNDIYPYLKYWIKTICLDLPEPLKSSVCIYLKYYEFDDAIALFKRFHPTLEAKYDTDNILLLLET
jgi:hypothetical protein